MPMQITINSWNRIVLPLSDADGRITRILTCNMPGVPFILHARDSRRQQPDSPNAAARAGPAELYTIRIDDRRRGR